MPSLDRRIVDRITINQNEKMSNQSQKTYEMRYFLEVGDLYFDATSNLIILQDPTDGTRARMLRKRIASASVQSRI